MDKRCERCQLEFAESTKTCTRCGGPLSVVYRPFEGLYCTECGGAARRTWKFCRRCGSKLDVVEEVSTAAAAAYNRLAFEPPRIEELRPIAENRCPVCHTESNSVASFCDICGTDLQETVARSSHEFRPKSLTAQGSRTAELVPLTVSAPVALTFGGYVEEPGARGEAISPREGKRFNRIPIVASVLILILFGMVVLFWWSRPVGQPSQQPAAQPKLPAKTDTPRLVSVNFTVETVEKEDELAGGHAHVIVKMDDQALFIIRDEDGFSSPMDRAKAVTDNLRRAVTNSQRDTRAEFQISHGLEGPMIVQMMPDVIGEKQVPIIRVTKHDVKGYARRSHGSLTADQLAQWWMNRLKDRVNLFVKGEASRLTANDEDGRLLSELYDRSQKDASAGRPTRESVLQALTALNSEQRHLLAYEGVRAIPSHTDHH